MTDTSAPQAPLNAYTCTDIDDGYSTTVRAESASKAAQAYVDGGGWHVDDRTIWIRVRVDGHGVHRIAIEPEAPTCANNSDGHDWRDLYTTGSGGGVLITERCHTCQMLRHVDTWAQCPVTGEQGLHSLRYDPNHPDHEPDCDY